MIVRYNIEATAIATDPSGDWVSYDAHVRETKLLRSQLAARDAALDAILQLARDWLDVDSQQTVNAYLSHNKGAALRELLLKHGIHPK